MEIGTYVFQLKATDSNVKEVSDNVQVQVLPVPPNQPPFVSAGINTTIKLPTNGITLTGSATDADGTSGFIKVDPGCGTIRSDADE